MANSRRTHKASNLGACQYHLCDSRGSLSKCQFCDKFFCPKHLDPVSPAMPFRDKAEHDRWSIENAHPCPDYVEVEAEREERMKESQYAAFKKMSTSRQYLMPLFESVKKDSSLKIILVIIAIMSLGFFVWGNFSLFANLARLADIGSQHPAAIVAPIVSSPTPATTTATAMVPPDPFANYVAMVLPDFIANCSVSAVLTGTMKQAQVVDGNSPLQMFVVSSFATGVPLENYPPEDRPTTMDATGQVAYRFYGKPSIHEKSDYRCWMKIEKITATSQATTTYKNVPIRSIDTVHPLPTATITITPTTSVNQNNAELIEQIVHSKINLQRNSNQLPSLTFDNKLADVARAHSQDMLARNFFAHVNPSGQDPTARANAAGYSCYKDFGTYYTNGIAENIFQTWTYSQTNYVDGIEVSRDYLSNEQIADQVVAGWMNSPGHRQNILTSTYSNEGIGVAIGIDGKIEVTEDFC